MYDDYEIDQAFNNEFYAYDLDEIVEYHMHNASRDMQNIQDAYDSDDDYARDSCDYNDLAYRHYAWYNKHTTHGGLMYARKRIVSVTLDIECYDDLELEDMDWREILDLQGDENVHVDIKELADVYWCDTFWTVHRVLTSCLQTLILSTVQTNPMDFDTDFWQEIADMPGEIFDIPEMQDDVLDFQQALNSDEDF